VEKEEEYAQQQQQRFYGRKRTMAGRTGELQAKRGRSRVTEGHTAETSSTSHTILVLRSVVYDENMQPMQSSELKDTDGVCVHCPNCDTDEGVQSIGRMEFSED
jgi:hypothetical protein